MADRHQAILITAYADNIIITGQLNNVSAAILDVKQALMDIGLKLNTLESQIHIPAWSTLSQQQLESKPNVISTEQPQTINFEYSMDSENRIPLALQGIRVLGCPIGVPA